MSGFFFNVLELELSDSDLKCLGHDLLGLGYRAITVEDLDQAEDVHGALSLRILEIQLALGAEAFSWTGT